MIRTNPLSNQKRWINLEQKENIFAALLGAAVALAYTFAKASWSGESLANVTLMEALAAAAIGAVAGVIAFLLRQRI